MNMSGLKSAWELSLERSEKLVPELKNKKKITKKQKEKIAEIRKEYKAKIADKDVMLQDDSNGQGPYIKSWNLAIAQPSAEQLSAVDSDADAIEALAAVHSARRTAYGDVGSQLDMQYHDNVDGTTTWKDHVAKVKADHPKP